MRKTSVFVVALCGAMALGFAPEEGAVVSQLRPEFRKYQTAAVAPVGTDLDWNAIAGKGDFSTGNPVKFAFDAPMAALELSTKADMTDAKTYDVDGGKSFEVVNLLVNTRYWWRTTDAAGKKSDIRSFRTADETPRWITVPGLSNVRDIGNRKSKRYGGRTRQGLLFRGSEFDDHMKISDEGRRVILEELKIRTDLDFRAKRFMKSDKYTPVFDGKLNHVLMPLTDYVKVFDDKDTQERYRRIFSLLADRSNYPVYAHCWGGADRTGTLVFFVESALGFSDRDLLEDYEITSFAAFGRRKRVERLTPFLKKLGEYGDAEDSYGTRAEKYLLGIGVKPEELQALRDILLEK